MNPTDGEYLRMLIKHKQTIIEAVVVAISSKRSIEASCLSWVIFKIIEQETLDQKNEYSIAE